MAKLAKGYNVVLSQKIKDAEGNKVDTPIYPRTKASNVITNSGKSIEELVGNIKEGQFVPDTKDEDVSDLKFLRNDNTWANIQEATTQQKGVVELSDSTELDSSKVAATAKAVKEVNDSIKTISKNLLENYPTNDMLGVPETKDGHVGIATLDKDGKLNENQIPTFLRGTKTIYGEVLITDKIVRDTEGNKITPVPNTLYVDINTDTRATTPTYKIYTFDGKEFHTFSSGSGEGASDAIDVNYDNTKSQLNSVNAQNAIDEVADKVNKVPELVQKLSDNNGSLEYDGKPISGGSSADTVTYENETYPEYTNTKLVLDALVDKVFYVKPAITSFNMVPANTLYEIGSTINTLQFNWTTNKDITSQSLTGCDVSDPTVRTAAYTTPITTDKSFTLSISDGKETANSTKSIKFVYKAYYGSAAIPSEYNSEFLLGLAKKELKPNKSGTYQETIKNAEYFFIAVPASYNSGDELSGKIGGFETTFAKVATITHVNESGASASYNIYKSSNHSLGLVTFII